MTSRLSPEEKRLLLLTLERTLRQEFPNACALLEILVDQHEQMGEELDRLRAQVSEIRGGQ